MISNLDSNYHFKIIVKSTDGALDKFIFGEREWHLFLNNVCTPTYIIYYMYNLGY